MKARILLTVAFFILPNFLLAQNLYTQLVTPVSLHQNQIKSHCNNNSYVKLIESINPLKHRSDSLRSSCDSTAKSLYFIRFAGIDKEDCINFYGFSLGWFHQNPNANFSGLVFSVNLGTQSMEGNFISVNGINIALFHTRTRGTINGISISAIGNAAGMMNGLQLGIIGTTGEYSNGLTMGGCISQFIEVNGIQISLINFCCRLNGLGIGGINGQLEGACQDKVMIANGLVVGAFNFLDVNGLSIAAMNLGNSWLQIGIVNIGNSTVQIGLVNLDENRKMGIPLINVNI
jgi:hypothetical protein